jgi:questin oxidase-like protein
MDYSTIDSALEELAPYGPDLRNGLTSHAPMVVEALGAMDRADALRPWLDRYRDGLLPRPRPTTRIAPDGWRAALGATDRTEDWSVFFTEALAEAPWADVLARWTVRLAPGFCGSAMHGIIRVGHAVRSLAASPTPPRLRELADALGYWAANYQALPTATGAPRALPAAAAIAEVPLVPEAQRRFAGTIVSSLEALDAFPPFAPVIGLLDVHAAAPDALVSDLSEAFCRVYLANAHDTLSTIVFVHGVTGVVALRSILPHLDDAAARALVAFAWQGSCALYAAFATGAPRPDRVAAPAESWDTLVDRAIANGDEHAIKLTEACLREDALRPSAAYLASARHAIGPLVAV